MQTVDTIAPIFKQYYILHMYKYIENNWSDAQALFSAII